MTLAALITKIHNKQASIAVIGLGYVGLPVAALFAEKGFDVLGVEVRQDRVDIINSGRSPIEGDEPGLADLIEKVVSGKNFKATTDYNLLKDRDIILIDVETPVNDAHVPEYRALRAALQSLAVVMKPGVLVIIESTIMPGTMKNIALPLLEEMSGGKCNQNFFLGNCPERVMPGRLLQNLKKMKRVVGGGSPETAEAMLALYNHIVEDEIDKADWITAELVKTVENAYRDVQIAFANEVALISEALGADVWRVRELVRKSPGREMLLPGAGVGGHCIPKDPWLLASSVQGLGVPIRLIPAARAINSSMPLHIKTLLERRLGSFKRKKILVLGYAYLENSDDTRESPAAVLVDALQEDGAECVIHDPFVREYNGNLVAMGTGCDAAVLMTAHEDYRQMDYNALKQAMRNPLLVDGRNALDKDAAIASGFSLVRLGDTTF